MSNGRKRLIAFATVLAILGIMVLVLSFIRIKTVRVEGSVNNSKETVINRIFGSEKHPITALFYLETKFRDEKSIPFVEKYEIEFVSLTEVKITIYEKKLIAYLEYAGCYIYLDKDGIVVESSDTKINGVPLVTGFHFDQVVMMEALPVEDDDVFDELLNLTKLIEKYQFKVKKIQVDEKTMDLTIYIRRLSIELGRGDQLAEKMSDLADMLPVIRKKRGKLDMSQYMEDGNYSFKETE